MLTGHDLHWRLLRKTYDTDEFESASILYLLAFRDDYTVYLYPIKEYKSMTQFGSLLCKESKESKQEEGIKAREPPWW